VATLPGPLSAAFENIHSHHVERWLSHFAELELTSFRAGYDEWVPRWITQATQ